MTLPECITLAENFAMTIFSVKLIHDCFSLRVTMFTSLKITHQWSNKKGQIKLVLLFCFGKYFPVLLSMGNYTPFANSLSYVRNQVLLTLKLKYWYNGGKTMYHNITHFYAVQLEVYSSGFPMTLREICYESNRDMQLLAMSLTNKGLTI